MRLLRGNVTRRSVVAGGAVAAAAVAAGVALGVSRAGAASGAAGSGSGDGSGDAAEDGAAKMGPVEAAGKLTIYTSCNEALVNAFVVPFTEKTGIAVDVQTMSCAQWQAAVAEEVAAGINGADVVWGGDRSCFEGVAGLASPQKVSREVCALAVSWDVDDKVREKITGYSGLAAIAAGATGLAAQVCLADPTADEDGFLQLLGLLCAGERATAAATTAGSGAATTVAQLGTDSQWAYAQSFLSATGAKTLATMEDVENALVAGTAQVALMPEQRAYALAAVTGMVDVVLPAEGACVTPSYMARVASASNKDQVTAWFDYVCGEEGQRAAARVTYLRPIEDAVDLPQGMTADDDAGFLSVDESVVTAARPALLATWPQVQAGTWVPAAEAAASAASAEAPEEAPATD